MFERTLFVKYVPAKDNFIYLPPSLKFLGIGTCLGLFYEGNKVAYCSVGTISAELNENSVGLNSLYAKALGFEENLPVILSELPQLASVNSITISPASKNDYDVIEILSENIQATLLNQIRVVFSSQSFIIWIGNNIHVTVYVDEVKPASPGVIDFLTEVHIKPNSSHNKNESLDIPKSETPNNKFIFDENTMKFYNTFFNKENDRGKSFQYLNRKHDLICRLVPLDGLPFEKELSKNLKPFNVFISKKCITKHWLKENTSSTPIICSLTLMINDIFSEKTVYARLILFEDILEGVELTQRQQLFVDQQIFQILDCQLGSRVILKYIENSPFVNEITVNTKINYLVNVEEKFKEYLARNSDDVTVLNANVPVNIGGNVTCSLKFSPSEQNFCLVDDNLVRNCKYIIQNDCKVEAGMAKAKKDVFEGFLDNISNMKTIVEDVMENFADTVGSFENVLITGKPGSGKSTLSEHIASKLQKYPFYIYVKAMKCKNIKGKTMDSLLKTFSAIFSDLLLYQPSVLILDDLDVLCENIASDGTAPNAVYFDRISDMLHNFFKLFSYPNQIGICAIVESTGKLNKNLFSSRGSHLFKNVYSIDECTKLHRKIILNKLFDGFPLDGVDFEELSMKTEGFVIQDIVDFHNKTLFEAYKDVPLEENVSEVYDSIVISKDHCERALNNTCVLSLQNVHLHSPGDNDFSHIGGLHDIKKVLVENLLWPAQYPDIFSKAPLRLQSGLLLYGPPGTGKTLLAAAAAKQCGLRLISVKGPELLSKYIGATEQAVRDIFQKAQSVKPCILFFDEFDSLAPRRGHDNTGVTDRVVNQLLTQLDGVESLTGVCVLAATSRPDLLDPALLRPGRLDKQLLCPLPDKDSRLEILRILSKNLDLVSDVNLEEIAAATESLSGADLQSLMYTAQLSSIGYLQDEGKVSSEVLESEITQKHLLEAMAKTKPSLPYQERSKYERIYAKFQTGSTVEYFKTSRATLA